MPEADTQTDSPQITREVPVDVTAEVIDTPAAAEPKRTLAIRQVLTRQLDAGQGLTGELLGAATDISSRVTRSPASFIEEIQDGATLPEALTTTRDGLAEDLNAAGDRIRGAVGRYVTSQAPLPNTVIVGGSDIATAMVRARGSLVDAALEAAFNLARIAVQGGDVRAGFSRERSAVTDRFKAVRADIDTTLNQARQEIDAATAPLYGQASAAVAVSAGTR